MAGNAQLSFAIKAINEASAQLKSVQGDLDTTGQKAKQASDHTGGFGSALGGVAKIASGFVLGSGLLQAPGFLLDAAKAAAEDEQAQARLKTSLENYLKTQIEAEGVALDSAEAQGELSDGMRELTQDMDERIAKGQKLAFSDDEMRDSMQLLLAATGDYGEAAKRQAAAMDLARGANLPLAMATKMLGKMNAENVEVFKRLGITMGDNATEADALAAVQAKFGGQADAYAKSTAGQFEVAKIRMSELKESIGANLLPIMAKLGEVLSTKVIPFLELAAEWISVHVVPVVKQFVESQVIPQLEAAFAQLKQTIDGLMPVARDIAKWFQDNPIAIAAVVAVLGLLLVALFPIPAAILAVIAVGTLLLANWDAIRDKATELKQRVEDEINNIVTKVRELPVIGEIFEGVFNAVRLIVETQFNVIKNQVETAINVVRDIINIVTALIHGDWDRAWQGVKQLVSDIFDGIKRDIELKLGLILGLISVWASTLINAFWDALGPTFDWGVNIVDGIWRGIQSVAGWLYDKVTGFAKGIFGSVKSGLGSLWPGSPSRAGIAIGEGLGQGIEVGVGRSMPNIIAAIYDVNKRLLTIGDGSVRDALKQQLAALQQELSSAVTPAGGGSTVTTPGGVTTPTGETTPFGDVLSATEQKALTILLGNINGLSLRDIAKRVAGIGESKVLAFFRLFEGSNASLFNTENLLNDLRTTGLLSFGGGGTVPGPWGAPRLAVVHGGETVTTPSVGGLTINIYAMDSQDVRRRIPEIAEELRRYQGRGMR